MMRNRRTMHSPHFSQSTFGSLGPSYNREDPQRKSLVDLQLNPLSLLHAFFISCQGEGYRSSLSRLRFNSHIASVSSSNCLHNSKAQPIASILRDIAATMESFE